MSLSLVFIEGELMSNSKVAPNIVTGAVALLFCVCFLRQGAAAVVTPAMSVTIKQSYAYSSFGGGDFVFATTIGAPGCENGWYVRSTDPGYKAIVATVLAAQSGGNYVLVYGDNADIWAGSNGHFCHVQSVGLTS
jgi:hypothetical protein